MTRRGLWRLAFALLALVAGPRLAQGVTIEEAANDTAGVDRHDARWRRHVCTYQSCQPYIYDPVKGEPRRGVAPGTAFADLPDTFRCPICGKGHKGDFAAYDD